MRSVVVVNNFISKEFCNYMINFMEVNLDNLVFDSNKGRHIIKFGYDNEFPNEVPKDISILGSTAQVLEELFEITKDTVETVSGKDELFLSSFFLSKHVSGGIVPAHIDSDEYINNHLEYTAMLYLNDSDGSGKIMFPNLNVSVTPEAGSLVIFEANKEIFEHSVDEITYDRYSIPMWFTSQKSFAI